MREKQFYLVWNPRGGNPTVRHERLDAAKAEAERLARRCPGEEFHVLLSVGTAKKVDVKWVEHDQIPF